MMLDLSPILLLGQGFLETGFVIFLRVGGLMAVLPAFGEQFLSARIKLVLSFAFTLVVAPAVAAPVQAVGGGAIILGEALIGLALGVGIRFFVLALQVAGTIAAQATSLSQLFGGTSGEPQPAVGHLLTTAGLALAVMAGLHVQVAALIIASYDVLPPGQLPDAEALRAWGVSGVTRTFGLAFSIAAPFVLAGLVYNVALGVINRAMPQLMVSFVGAPALTLGGLALLAIAVPSGLVHWHASFTTFLNDAFGGAW
ncbi:flagellar biosynthetic protein FliR [Phaeovulum sp. NW3]|uniref:flagellar biosynthetic protein FliR n=1 Tax=Phaeovulum sp. NW3 TaxID=2934933 RepID=UPI00201FD1AE|nr:flagellar biosynthetic protein FliR [Phaeovulum sp. NW3]MCL7466489.1 flagellar biosynthetic protein FliR [Phaeovulum sp. NW3]